MTKLEELKQISRKQSKLKNTSSSPAQNGGNSSFVEENAVFGGVEYTSNLIWIDYQFYFPVFSTKIVLQLQLSRAYLTANFFIENALFVHLKVSIKSTEYIKMWQYLSSCRENRIVQSVFGVIVAFLQKPYVSCFILYGERIHTHFYIFIENKMKEKTATTQ